MKILDEKVKKNWDNYLWQSLGAGISIFLVLVLFTSTVDLVIKAAVGSTAFTVFALPDHSTARPRSVIGGQTIGALVGLSCSLLPGLYLQGGLAVAMVSFLMVTFDSEHPPAAGTALGLAISPSWEGAVFVLLSSGVLSAVRWALRDSLVDLT